MARYLSIILNVCHYNLYTILARCSIVFRCELGLMAGSAAYRPPIRSDPYYNNDRIDTSTFITDTEVIFKDKIHLGRYHTIQIRN